MFFWALGALITFAWLTLWVWDRSPYGRYLEHGALGDLSLEASLGALFFRIALYLVGWTVMTVAMMLPTVFPLLAIFRRMTDSRADPTSLLALVVGGYLFVWTLFGAIAHVGDWLLHQLVERVALLEAQAWFIGAATLLMAGAFQFSSLKYRCLDKCRAPLSFVMEHWGGRHDSWNAFRLGIAHGKFCVGCCWALMLLMFGVGVGNLGWMFALGALMAVEKNLPWGKKLTAPLGVVLLGWGGVIIASHL